MVANKPGHQGEYEGNRKTIAQGMPVETGEPVATTSCFFARTMGASDTRHSLRPLLMEGHGFCEKPRARTRAGNAEACRRGCLLFESGVRSERVDAFFPLPLWERGPCIGDAKRVRGTVGTELVATPHPALRAAFFHKGRRKKVTPREAAAGNGRYVRRRSRPPYRVPVPSCCAEPRTDRTVFALAIPRTALSRFDPTY